MGLKPRETDRLVNVKRSFVQKRKRREGRVKTRWVVRGEEFFSKRAAAEYFEVTEKTILRWCKGYNKNGERIPPERDCYAEEV